jgi:hypothetical protein
MRMPHDGATIKDPTFTTQAARQGVAMLETCMACNADVRALLRSVACCQCAKNSSAYRI